MSSFILAVAGGSGSGKTTFARRLFERIGKNYCGILGQDSYYIDQSHRFDHDGGSVNFDHPNSLDFLLMEKHIKDLKEGKNIEVPIYDFSSHSRKSEVEEFENKKIIIVDGILILSQKNLRDYFDHSVFIDTPEDLRFSRRLKRDIEERGREELGVRNQFYKQVKPMHDEFVEPSKDFSETLVCPKSFEQKLDELVDYIFKTIIR